MQINRLYIVAYALFFVACGSTQIVETNPENVRPAAVVESPSPDGPDGLKAEMPGTQSGSPGL